MSMYLWITKTFKLASYVATRMIICNGVFGFTVSDQ